MVAEEIILVTSADSDGEPIALVKTMDHTFAWLSSTNASCRRPKNDTQVSSLFERLQMGLSIDFDVGESSRNATKQVPELGGKKNLLSWTEVSSFLFPRQTATKS